ncbi:unnamed protein product [Adineta steineri]|uniref:G-protein coupled receptors family 1 profile domain-containing protein n=1 Tax=Adineta steineri TaxID=433720 RepID=A0A813XS34_9BILA|nr:unnamed protein product [Adineta steineri]CAF3856981.1 unnamed protein product [Adineta steineri]
MAALNIIQQYLFQIACPLLLLIGIAGCILNLIAFSRKNMRKNPCSIYFIAFNLANFIYINVALLNLILEVGYNISPSASNLIICRLRVYISTVFDCLSPFYLLLASIDRIFITSKNALTRRRSNLGLAYICIVSGTLFWVLFSCHALIWSNILQIGPNLFLCYFQGVYLTFFSCFAIIKEMTTFLSLTICGIWAIKNIRSIHRVRVAPSIPNGHDMQRTSAKDRQLIFMLVIDVIMYALFSFTFASFLIYQEITQNDLKSNEQIQIESFIRNLSLFSIAIPFCVSFYANLIVSSVFRKEIKKILSRQ